MAISVNHYPVNYYTTGLSENTWIATSSSNMMDIGNIQVFDPRAFTTHGPPAPRAETEKEWLRRRVREILWVAS